MTTFILRRLGTSIITLILVSLVIFTALRLLPGDPATTKLVQADGLDPDAIAQLKRSLGLDLPIIVQYWRWISALAVGDFGSSYFSGIPVSELLAQQLGPTLELSGAALLVGVLLALVFGVAPTMARKRSVQAVSDGFTTISVAAPSFIVGIVLILVFAKVLGVLPVNGYVDPAQSLGGNLQHLVLPALTLGIFIAGPLTRYIQASVVDVTQSTFVRTALGKGLTWHETTLRHIVPNALLPALTSLGITIGTLIGGVVVVEQVFAWPGVGQQIIDAVFKRDYAVIQAATLLASAVFLLVSLIVDLLYGLIDPRLRVAKRSSHRQLPTLEEAAQ